MSEERSYIKNKDNTEKRMRAGNLSLFAAIFLLTSAYFHFYSWYSLLAPYGTLVAAFFLIITLLCYVDISYMIRDPAFYLMAAADLFALINLFLIGSHKGAILTVFDILLVLYLSNKLVFTDKEILISSAYMGIFFIYWTIDVKGYFKGYNTNYGGLVLITGFIFLIFFLESLLERVKKRGRIYVIRVLEILLFYVAIRIIAWYRSRCALIGLMVFLILFLVPKSLWKNRLLYGLPVLAGTIGPVVFSAFYVFLGMHKEELTLRLFYKDIISGREEIWAELWGEYLKKPITGIGSSYEMKLEWMEGLFEVHSGLLDILIVHGIFVFIVTAAFFVFRLFAIREAASADNRSKVAMAGIFSMMFTAFMENYIIVAPFNLCLLLLFTYAGSGHDLNPE